MEVDKLERYDSYLLRRESAMRRCYGDVQRLLEGSYKLNPNVVEKMLDTFFSPDFLPNWYFHSNSPKEISNHVFIITQLLNARTEHLRQVSDDGRAITYFLNVGRDFPGKLLALVEENEDMGIVAVDSAKTRSGIRIVTMERGGRRALRVSSAEQEEIDELLRKVREHGASLNHDHTDAFILGLPENYLNEEINSLTHPRRILRHEDLFEEAFEGDLLAVRIANTQWEIDDANEKLQSAELRCAIGVRNPDKSFLASVLTLFKDAGINLIRSYYDTLSENSANPTIGILSIYVDANENLDAVKSLLAKRRMPAKADDNRPSESLNNEMERIIRALSDPTGDGQNKSRALQDLKKLAEKNSDLSSQHEYGNFLLNAISDFFEGAKLNGLYDSDELLTRLIAYDAFDEFWIETRKDHVVRNSEGYRIKHSSARGPHKGGIRNDMIVRFDEVAALSFMMSWKCARSKVLFGGAKGGLKIAPEDYKGKAIDFFDTLTNFGRSLFLVTGPARDVPAGDVGCGALEIGHMFEGFKSALRDLATMAYGLKQGVAFVGDKVMSIEQARDILENYFNVDYRDRTLLRELTANEKYLELVAAAQITGKPRMGIAARTGATGRGLCSSILAAVCNLYLDGKWEIETQLDEADVENLRKVTALDESMVLESGGFDMLGKETWTRLESHVFPVLLSGKSVVVQGFGKVGISLLQELGRFGVRIKAVADIRGAVVGDDLSLDALLSSNRESGTVTALSSEDVRIIMGKEAGAQVLEIPCDIIVPAALENCVSTANARKIRAKIEACGSNGPNTSKGERILSERGITVIYDFLANSGGVTASYFEWLRNLCERFRYEAEEIHGTSFSVDLMDPYLMPEYKGRIKTILIEQESPDTTTKWNLLLRDIMFAAVNEDYRRAADAGVSMKSAGFASAQLRVLSAIIARSNSIEQRQIWERLSKKSREAIQPFLNHPEVSLFGEIEVSE